MTVYVFSLFVNGHAENEPMEENTPSAQQFTLTAGR